jgi:hypothetical protein
MADELVEPKEIVPENAELFTQSVMPEEAPPVPAPTPEPVDVPEPELPPVEPDWLSAPEMPPEQPAAPPQQPDYNYQQPQPPQPQYPQQPQVPQYGTPDAALQTFVDNPDGWADQKIEQRLAARDAAYQQQNQAIANMTGMIINDRISEGMSGANGAIKKAYDVFNQDTAFRANKEMQDSLGATLQGMRQRAEYEARTRGNFEPLRTLANLDESDMAATLAYMKAKAGVHSPGTGPLQVDGATVESSRSAVAEQTVELTPEEYEIARRLGPGQEAKIKQAKLDMIKFDDLDYKG